MPMHTYMASSLRTKESIQLGSLLDEEQELSLTLVLRSLDQARQNELNCIASEDIAIDNDHYRLYYSCVCVFFLIRLLK